MTLCPCAQGEAQKQAALIEETAQRVRASAEAAEAAVNKDSKDASQLARAAFGKVH